MIPLTHINPAVPNGSPSASDLTFLTAAFSDFITASATLETSYQRLQMEVSHLSDELEERNTTLKASLAENQRVHAALEQIVNSMPCGILVVEDDGSVSMMNAEAASLLGIQELSGLRPGACFRALGAGSLELCQTRRCSGRRAGVLQDVQR